MFIVCLEGKENEGAYAIQNGKMENSAIISELRMPNDLLDSLRQMTSHQCLRLRLMQKQ